MPCCHPGVEVRQTSAAENNCSYAHVQKPSEYQFFKKGSPNPTSSPDGKRRIFSLLLDEAFMGDELFFSFLSLGQDN